MAYNVIIIGGGHNGLVAASKLAKAGKKVLVLERRPFVGGACVTEEVHPGFKYSTCAYTPGVFQQSIVDEFQLKQHGYELIEYDPYLFAPVADGTSLTFWNDINKTIESIAHYSEHDAKQYPRFEKDIGRLASILRSLWTRALPDPATVGPRDWKQLLSLGWTMKGTKEKDVLDLLRVLPMSIADLLNEYFENEHLKGVLASEGIFSSFYGPRSAGSVYIMLYLRMGRGDHSKQQWPLVRGGMGTVTQALAKAAEKNGVEIRTGAEVSKITIQSGVARGVTLANGEELQAHVIVSNADAKRTFLKLIEPYHLDPHFVLNVRNIRARGVSAKVNFAIDRYPKWKALNGDMTPVVVAIAPNMNYLERAFDDAKYGEYSRAPFLDISIPSVVDSSLAPSGQHVISVYCLFAPYHLKNGDWNAMRELFGDVVVQTIENYAPGFSDSILHRQVITPLDLERIYGLTEGHVHHQELSLDQIFFMRPVPGYSHYRSPIQNLYMCGASTHPGGGVTGIPGSLSAQAILSDFRSGKIV
jgi:phytoene dehydrogenase-like protein